MMKAIVMLILLVSILCTAAFAGGFVKADGTGLMLDGKPYRAMGANAPDLFVAYSGAGLGVQPQDRGKERQRAVDAILDAEKNKIAFFRFWATGFHPIEMKLYFDNPNEYWKNMDEVFNLCRQHNIKLVPSIFWEIGLWPLICEEDRSAIVDPNSRTYKAMHKYAREIVTRYKDDTNVLMWELLNEGFLGADVQMEGRDLGGGDVYLPTTKLKRSKYNSGDSLTVPILKQFYIEMTTYIKSLDPNHMVESGDAGVRDCSQSLRESFPDQVWVRDTFRQHVGNLLASQPAPLDVFCQHLYGSLDPNFEPDQITKLSALDYFTCTIRAVDAARMPQYIGEFGQVFPSFDKDPDAKFARTFIDLMDKEGVDLASVWVWHFPWQPENNVTSQSHPLLVKRIAQFNEKYAGLK
ncbi:MAG: cellulase family glycosylhydrolase [Armatimonadota bacterium]|nr:cellulase family glycosylhydrolase [bacterium]